MKKLLFLLLTLSAASVNLCSGATAEPQEMTAAELSVDLKKYQHLVTLLTPSKAHQAAATTLRILATAAGSMATQFIMINKMGIRDGRNHQVIFPFQGSDAEQIRYSTLYCACSIAQWAAWYALSGAVIKKLYPHSAFYVSSLDRLAQFISNWELNSVEIPQEFQLFFEKIHQQVSESTTTNPRDALTMTEAEASSLIKQVLETASMKIMILSQKLAAARLEESTVAPVIDDLDDEVLHEADDEEKEVVVTKPTKPSNPSHDDDDYDDFDDELDD